MPKCFIFFEDTHVKLDLTEVFDQCENLFTTQKQMQLQMSTSSAASKNSDTYWKIIIYWLIMGQGVTFLK